MSNKTKASEQRVADMAKVASREDRLADVRKWVLQQPLPRKDRFATYDQLIASDLAWLLQRHDEAMELLTIGTEDGWDHYQLDAARSLIATPDTAPLTPPASQLTTGE